MAYRRRPHAHLLAHKRHPDMLWERGVVEGAHADLAILAPAPAKDPAVMGQHAAVAVPACYLGNAQGPQPRYQGGPAPIAHVPVACMGVTQQCMLRLRLLSCSPACDGLASPQLCRASTTEELWWQPGSWPHAAGMARVSRPGVKVQPVASALQPSSQVAPVNKSCSKHTGDRAPLLGRASSASKLLETRGTYPGPQSCHHRRRRPGRCQ